VVTRHTTDLQSMSSSSIANLYVMDQDSERSDLTEDLDDEDSDESIRSTRSTSTVHSTYADYNDLELQALPNLMGPSLLDATSSNDLYMARFVDYDLEFDEIDRDEDDNKEKEDVKKQKHWEGETDEKPAETTVRRKSEGSNKMSRSSKVKGHSKARMEPLDESFGFVSGLSRLDLDDVFLGDAKPKQGIGSTSKKKNTESKFWARLNTTLLILLGLISGMALFLILSPYLFAIFQEEESSGLGDDTISLLPPTTGEIFPALPARVEITRMEFIKKQIHLAGLSSLEDLEDEESIRYHALRWLSLVDDFQLPVNDPHLTERYALAVFFYANRPDISKAHSMGEWHLNRRSKQWKGWMMEKTVCDWKGIYCVHDRLVEFNLTNSNLSIDLPPEIRGLSDLVILDLSTNEFTGPIPDLVLPNQNNEGYSGLTQLEYLYLYRNQFSGILPNSITHLRSLLEMKLSDNQLSGKLPHDWDLMMNLQKLNVARNSLEGTLPLTVQTMVTLKVLQVQENKFHGPLPHLAFATDMTMLYFGQNQFTGTLPESWTSMNELKDIIVSENKLFGTIPIEYGEALHNLKRFSARVNSIEGSIPTEFGLLTRLQHLLLDHNKLTGSLPSELSRCEHLYSMHLQGNQLEGLVAEEVCELVSFKSLAHISTDCETGSITCSCCEECF